MPPLPEPAPSRASIQLRSLRNRDDLGRLNLAAPEDGRAPGSRQPEFLAVLLARHQHFVRGGGSLQQHLFVYTFLQG